jgi:hypothetical protein
MPGAIPLISAGYDTKAILLRVIELFHQKLL